MQKCYGKDCIVGFLCRQTTFIDEFLQRCDLISKNIEEGLSKISKDISDNDILDKRTEVIISTYKEICEAIDHPYIEQIIDDLIFQCGDSDGYYYSAIEDL